MTFLAADFTVFDWIPGYASFDAAIASRLGGTLLGGSVETITHISLSIVGTLIVLGMAMVARNAWSSSSSPEIPEGRFTFANLIEVLLDGALGLGEQIFGSKETARRFLPIVGTLGLYIVVNNLLGLVPGFAPATENLNVTVGPAIIVFLITHYIGVKASGMHYFEHFLGPKLGKYPLLAPLMLPIEIISHLARPLSLSLRLMGNMMGDHKVVAIFLSLLYFTLPVLFMGTLVCIVQALVFCLLSMVYFALAIEHTEEAH